MLPPLIVRRLVLVPLLLVVTVAVVVTLPLLALVAVAASPLLPGRWRALRLLVFALVWLALESVTLFVCLGLWIVSGFGGRLRPAGYQERHYGVMRWFLATVYRVATRAFRLTVEIVEPELTPEEAAARLTRPVIVLSRHAGPGDSFLLIHHLLSRYRRRPRIVMKAALQFDPSLDVVINRLPHAFVTPRRGADSGVIQEIGRLASDLGPTGALVIFPEGGNFTPRRRLRAIERLDQRQLVEQAARARAMEHLLAPRSGGALAAIAAAPTADVIFVAHTGLDDLITAGDIWRSLPMEKTLKSCWWRVFAADVPREREARVRWLYDWWERIDAWIGENRPATARPGAADPGRAGPRPRPAGAAPPATMATASADERTELAADPGTDGTPPA